MNGLWVEAIWEDTVDQEARDHSECCKDHWFGLQNSESREFCRRVVVGTLLERLGSLFLMVIFKNQSFPLIFKRSRREGGKKEGGNEGGKSGVRDIAIDCPPAPTGPGIE